MHTLEQILQRLGDEVFHVAAEILQMIAKTPQERMLYNARIKFQRDEASKLLYAQREGKAEGRAEGGQIGVIHFLQQLLSLPESAEEKLSQMTTDSRAAMIADLKEQLRKRSQPG